MKILSAEQIKRVDAYTIQHEPIASIDLMERAAMACFKRLLKICTAETSFHIYCGMGNNGGDGMALGRLMIERGYSAVIFVVHAGKNFSDDAQRNYELLKSKFPEKVKDIRSSEDLPSDHTDHITVIDAIFGSGLNKAVEGLAAETINFINQHYQFVISIDVPSGLFIDASSSENKFIVKANLVLSLQFPKLAFLLPENKDYASNFEIIDIGLKNEAIEQEKSYLFYLAKSDVRQLLKPRNKFDHKGTFGHALLLAGSEGKAGAAIISAGAGLRSGAGLLTLHSTPDVNNNLINHYPEAMSEMDPNPDHISEVHKPENYDAIGFGPGAGMHEETEQVLKKILHYYSGPMVIDADGLNILAENKTWMEFFQPNTILTPHPKEFERLFGKAEDDFERLKLLRHSAMKLGIIIILKGAHSAIAMPDGNIFFNSSGNPGLAKGGSGDALTGVILGLLARGYTSSQAALIGTFVHGYAADLCLKKMSEESILASDLIKNLPKAFKKIEGSKS